MVSMSSTRHFIYCVVHMAASDWLMRLESPSSYSSLSSSSMQGKKRSRMMCMQDVTFLL